MNILDPLIKKIEAVNYMTPKTTRKRFYKFIGLVKYYCDTQKR